MRSQLSVRLGAQTPVIVHRPPDVVSLAAAEEAIELADAYGLCDGFPLDESQRFTLRTGMGERADGSWAASQVGDFKGRQGGGKSDTIAARELYGLVVLGEPLIIHTAHEFPTANESFLRLVDVFLNWDDLGSKVARVLYGNGTQSINLKSGQRILYKARTGGAGRGFTKAALVVYDEAQHLTVEHVAASGPTRLAYPNSQSWYAGSGGFETSRMSWALRRRALSGDGGRLAYVEGTAEQVSLEGGRVVSVRPDPYDRDGWAAANPGMGRWVTEESLSDLFNELGPEAFARECMCVWEPELGTDEQLIPMAVWNLCCAPDVAPSGRLVFAVDVGEERDCAAIVAVSEGREVEVVEATAPDVKRPERSGSGWLAERIGELVASREHGNPPWVYDASGPVASVIDGLKPAVKRRMRLRPLPGSDLPAACGRLFDDIAEARIRVRRDRALDAAVAGASRSFVGDRWRFVRKDSSTDITALMAMTAGLWAAAAPSPRPRIYTLKGVDK
jgi:hypothetical protein